MSQAPTSKRPLRGRPPNADTKKKVLNVAYQILIELGFGRLSIEGVAAKSGVGKPTIYRYWANASELAMAALMEPVDVTEPSGSRPLWDALQSQLNSLVAAFANTRGRQIALALAASDPESEISKAFRNRIILASREQGRKIISEAALKQEIAPPKDVEVVLDMIYAPIFYRILVRHLPLDQEFARQLSCTVFGLLEGHEPRLRKSSI